MLGSRAAYFTASPLAAGGFIIRKAKNKMAKQRIVPRTAAELDKDKQWLKRQR